MITPDEYAKQRGCSGRAVRKAIATGRLVDGVKRNGGRWLIDPPVADVEWQRNTAPQFQREKKGGGRVKGEGGRPPRAPAAAPPPAAGDAPPPKLPSQAQAAAARTMYQAKLLELDLKERQALLVPKADVDRVWFEEGRRVRDAVRRTPQQMIGDIARVVGGMNQEQRAEVLLILERHLVKTLEGLASAD
jgi:hypothetical protein